MSDEYIKKSEILSKMRYYEDQIDSGFEYVTKDDIEGMPTYSFPVREKIGTCSKCGKQMEKIKSIKHGKYDFWYCPTCFAEMRGDSSDTV